MKRVIAALAVVFAFLTVLAGCGGNKKSTTPSTTVTVSVSPSTATVNTTATQQFTATVANSTNTNVTWTVNGVAGGNQTVGFISSSGLYTAPNTVPTPATVTVTATSQAETSVSGSATVTITAPSTPSATLVVSPTSVTLSAGAQQTFTATISGSAATVNWTVNCQSSVAGGCGSITSAGVYTAPLSPPPGGNVSITATVTSGGAPPAGAVVMVQFGNATLTGQYAFSFSGQNAGNSFLAAGSVTFDGTGNITAGVEDINSAGVSSVTISGGTYRVGTDGRGNATVTTSAGTVNWEFAIVNHSRAYVIRFDSGVPSASGTMDLQDATQFSSAGFSGAYAFNLSGANSSAKAGTLAAAGALTSTGGGIISGGALDVNSAGTPSTGLSVSGTYSAPSASGRGTLILASGFGTQNFAYYIVDGTHVKVVETDTTAQLAGDLFKQPGGPFSNASFKGGFAFAFLGSTSRGAFGEGGVFTLDGAGKVTTGTFDINANGNPQNGLAVSGTYSVVDIATGRATVSVSVGGSTLQYAIYPQINGALSMVEIDASNTVAGRVLPQSGTFANGTLLGNYALNVTGTDFITNPGEEDIVAQVVPNGGSALAGVADISDNGVLARSATLLGSYSVASTGSGSATLTTGAGIFTTGLFNFYIADSGDVLFLESDANRVLVGIMQKQF